MHGSRFTCHWDVHDGSLGGSACSSDGCCELVSVCHNGYKMEVHVICVWNFYLSAFLSTEITENKTDDSYNSILGPMQPKPPWHAGVKTYKDNAQGLLETIVDKTDSVPVTAKGLIDLPLRTKDWNCSWWAYKFFSMYLSMTSYHVMLVTEINT